MALNTYQDEEHATKTAGNAKGASGKAEGNDRFEARYKIQKPLGVFEVKMGGSRPHDKNSG